MLKGIAAHYVMRAQDRLDLMERQRTLLHELFEAIWKRGSDALDPAFRARLRRGDRRRRPHPRGDRPDRQPHRRLRGRPSCRPGARRPARAREAGAMTTRDDPLVWLPFEPEVLGEIPDILRYERIDPEELPDSADEVEFYVLRLPLPPGRRRGARRAAEAAGRADADGRGRAHPAATCPRACCCATAAASTTPRPPSSPLTLIRRQPAWHPGVRAGAGARRVARRSAASRWPTSGC